MNECYSKAALATSLIVLLANLFPAHAQLHSLFKFPIYRHGGTSIGGIPIADPERPREEWTPAASWGASACSDGQYAYVFGGMEMWSDRRGKINQLWKFNPQTRYWEMIKGVTTSNNNPGIYGTQGVAHPSNMPGALQRQKSVGFSNRLKTRIILTNLS